MGKSSPPAGQMDVLKRLGLQGGFIEALFDRIPMGIFVLNREACLCRFNPTWLEQMERYAAFPVQEAAAGANLFALSPSLADGLGPLVKQALGGEPVSVQSLPLASRGLRSYWDVALTPLCTSEGQVDGVLCMMSDATQQVVGSEALQRTLQALREREERFDLVVRGTNDGIWDWNLQTQSVYYSPRWKAMIGYAENELDDSPEVWSSRVHPEDLPLVEREIQRHLNGETEMMQAETRFLHRDGTYRWILTRGVCVRDANGKPLRLVGSHADVTEKKQADEALRYRAAFENLIANTSTQFINLPMEEVDEGIRRTLERIGRFTGADRGYIFLFSDDYQYLNCVSEWVSPGVPPRTAEMRQIPVGQMRWSSRILLDGSVLRVNDVNALPAEAEQERLGLKGQGVRSLAAVPMSYQGRVLGYLGFDSLTAAKTWDEDSLAMLNMVGEIIANAMEHKRAQAIQDGQRQFLELLARGGSLNETLNALVQVVEEQWPGMMCLVLILDETGRRLHVGGAVSLPQAYLDEIEGIEIGPLVGSCGTACYTGQRVLVEDIRSDPRWEGLRETALRYGLLSCWSEPVIDSGGTVIATFAVYSQSPRLPTPAELQIIETGAHLVNVAVEHYRAKSMQEMAFQTLEERVKARTRELATLLEVSQNLTSTLDLDLLLGLILDQLRSVVDFTGASILTLEGGYLTVQAYRGPIPQEDVLWMHFPESEGINHLVISRRDVIIVPDVQSDTLHGQAFQSAARVIDDTMFAYVRCWMGIPLIIQDRVIGMLTLDHSQPGYYRVEHGRLALAFASHVAVAVENARLYGHARQLADEARTLLNVQAAISSRLDVDATLQMIADEARRLTNTAMSSVYLLEGDDLVVSVVSGEISRSLLGFRVPMEASVAGMALKSGQPVRVVDAGDDERVLNDLTSRVGASAFLIVPLISGRGAVGTITVSNKLDGQLGLEDERILMLMASSAIVALENARMYKEEQERRLETERRRKVAEGLRDILRVLNSNRPLDDVLNYVAEQANRMMGSTATMIRQGLPELNRVRTVASFNLPPDFDAIRETRFYNSEGDKILMAHRPIVIRDHAAALGARLANDRNLDEFQRAGIHAELKYYRSQLAVPLFNRNKIYGALRFYFAESRDFSDEDIRLAMTLGDQAALAVENAEMRAQMQEHAAAMERSRLARDLHDAVTQTLFSASLIAEVLPRIWEKNAEEGLKRLAELRQLTRGALAEMRTLLLELRPTALLEAELGELFRQLAEAFTGRMRLPVSVRIEGGCDLPSDVRVAFYRIAQEALNNIAKHAKATRVELEICCEDNKVYLSITDDGQGFAAEKLSSNHLGLGIMKERAEAIGADLEITSQPGQGTCVEAVWSKKTP
ncbi:GAF domain-containing protein [Levilinea saccharolytica]|nr:GAF domain-containing protein [Levilinea saccharolytica]GAP17099.1 protein containing PAS domain S-box [Levilinea saccharolytica]